MKVVINTQFGGFGLSIEAQKKIAKNGCEHSKWIDEDEYFQDSGKERRIKIWGSEEEAREKHCKFCEIPRENGKILLDEHASTYKTPKVRACPILVKVIEEMGEKANGQHTTLKVVEVPDAVEWTVEEYDGSEWIAEKHRTWR